MVSQDVQANLKKYKNAVGGRTPSRGRRSASRGPDDLGSVGSPTVHFEDYARGRSQGRKSIGPDDNVTASRQIRLALKEIDDGFGDKHTLLKMLVLRCDEADQNYNRLRNCINHGEVANADKILADLQA